MVPRSPPWNVCASRRLVAAMNTSNTRPRRIRIALLQKVRPGVPQRLCRIGGDSSVQLADFIGLFGADESITKLIRSNFVGSGAKVVRGRAGHLTATPLYITIWLS